jgi:hypothetical protein
MIEVMVAVAGKSTLRLTLDPEVEVRVAVLSLSFLRRIHNEGVGLGRFSTMSMNQGRRGNCAKCPW